MKTHFLPLILSLLLPSLALAHDFEAKNSDGVTIYYNKTSSTEVAVTYRGSYYYSYSGRYTGTVNIPSTVTYSGITYSVTAIRDYAFWGCSGLTSVTIPNSVTSIGDYAFYNCSGLTSVTIPNSVTSIGDYAFYNCSGLTSVTIPNSVTSIGDRAFYDCSGLKRVNISDIAAWCNISFVNGYSNPLYYAHSPYLNGEKVESLVIPDGVSSIGYYAFCGCSGLTSVTIPNSVTTIGDGAFNCCRGLTSVTISNSVTSIGNYAFSCCSGLTEVTIGNCVTSIGDYAFNGCSGLTEVTIPNSVTSIGNWAFSVCSGLTSVTIPNSVTSIGDKAFYSIGLNEIYSKIWKPKDVVMGSWVFDYVQKDVCTLYVPLGCMAEYKSTSQWNDFRNIVEMDFGDVVSGDCNGDGEIDAADIAYIVDYLLGIGHDGFDSNAADLNGDGKVNATDISRIIMLILSE